MFPFDNTYAGLPGAFYRPVVPSTVKAPQLIKLNTELAEELGIDADQLGSPEGLAVLSGNSVPPEATPIAMAYSGHQFGGLSPQLGDGRAILLGELIGKDGIRKDIQLKGSGPTPFSRRGDGRSALGPVLREYIVSEAMAALGVPTTRALAAVTTGEQVVRETMLAGGVFTRVAQSHIRVGTFQWFAIRQDYDNLRILADYTIDRHYPEARQTENPYKTFLELVIARQAGLIAHWMQLGFIHGVMNTDNMTVSGETIDYGPCAFLDNYHPEKTFSSIDQHGRYSYSNQSSIGLWNLTRFAETLLSLLDEDPEKSVSIAEETLDKYSDLHQSAVHERLTAKLGIANGNADDIKLAADLLAAMAEGEADFTLVFRHLSKALDEEQSAPVVEQFKSPEAITDWLSRWRQRMESEDLTKALKLMQGANPVYIPRNHQIQAAISSGYEGDFEPFHKLNKVLAQPFTERVEFAEYESAPAADEVVCATFCGT